MKVKVKRNDIIGNGWVRLQHDAMYTSQRLAGGDWNRSYQEASGKQNWGAASVGLRTFRLVPEKTPVAKRILRSA
jgi:hypothetical protein